MIIARWETRNWYWNISTTRPFRLVDWLHMFWPRWGHDPTTTGYVLWLCFDLEWVNKQWVEDCDRVGCGPVDMLEWAAGPGLDFDGESDFVELFKLLGTEPICNYGIPKELFSGPSHYGSVRKCDDLQASAPSGSTPEERPPSPPATAGGGQG